MGFLCFKKSCYGPPRGDPLGWPWGSGGTPKIFSVSNSWFVTQAAPNRVPTCPILSKIANFSFGLRGPRGLPQYPGPEDPKPKIDLKSFENIKKEAYMPILSSLSQKTKKLGLNMLARRFRRWTFDFTAQTWAAMKGKGNIFANKVGAKMKSS